MRAVVYSRISLDREGKAEGVTRQRTDALELVERRGWQLVREFEDNDTSASGKVRRPGFEAMLQQIEAGQVDAVVAWTLDRLTRNRRDTVRLIEACQQHRVTIALVRGSDLDMSTPSGRLVADVLASVARSEIEVKGDRQRRANLQRAQAGRPHIGRRTFGYDASGLSIVADEAALVRDAYSHFLAGGAIKSIARAWNSGGAVTTAGNPWTPGSVRGVLKNPRYAGLRFYHGERVAQGEWPAIVDELTWQAARARLNDPSRSTTDDRSIKFLLTNIAECGRCADGARVATGRTQHGVRVYKCTVRGDVARKAAPIDEFIEEVVITRLSQSDAADLMQSRPDVDVPGLRMALNAQRERMDEAATMFASGEISASQMATITRVSEAEVSRLESELAAAVDTDALAGVLTAGDVRAAWLRLDVMAKRSIVTTLFERIVVEPVQRGVRTFDPASVRVEWRS